jgi:hypothetical protein
LSPHLTQRQTRREARNHPGGLADAAPARQRLLFELQRRAGNRAVAALVQRSAVWNASGTVTQNIDVAPRATRGETTLGYTPPTLNGHQLDNQADARGTLNPPTIDVSRRGEDAYSASVTAVGNNAGSFNMELPRGGPWSAPASFQQAYSVAGRYGVEGHLGNLDTRQGQTELVFRPDPDEATFLANVQTHEQRHADDHRGLFATRVRAWDTRLTQAMDDHRTFEGASEDLARQALFTAAGGTPDQVATGFYDDCVNASNAFHRTDQGRGADGVSAAVEATGWWPFRNDYGRVAIRIRHP